MFLFGLMEGCTAPRQEVSFDVYKEKRYWNVVVDTTCAQHAQYENPNYEMEETKIRHYSCINLKMNIDGTTVCQEVL